MKKVLLYIHQLPQNLCGLVVKLFTKAVKKEDYGITFYHSEKKMGVSLGNYIIAGPYYDETILRHERGHQKQSLYLGWLYLIVIGLPSAIGGLISLIRNWSDEVYYRQPWEHWADKLGGVTR